jgi:uncharacterized protein YndB with AHSA1/START domain
MPFEVRETRTYSAQPNAVYRAALAAVETLHGQVLQRDPAQGRLSARFDKKLRGKVLGDRTQIEVECTPTPTGQTDVSVLVYPLDALNRKLMFGARKGVPETVLSWFFEDLERCLAAV